MLPSHPQNIAPGISNVVLGIEEKLLVNDLNILISPAAANQIIDELLQIFEGKIEAPDAVKQEIELREFIKTAFAAIGVEIEFSGKDKYEKAVVIDTDRDLAMNLKLPLDILMPGQTVVRIASFLN